MATIGSLALAIRARTEMLKKDLKPALDAIADWGKAAKASGADAADVAKSMAKMRQEAMLSGGASKGPDALAQGMTRAKQGAAALTGAISAVSSEMGGAVGHATRLGTSLISSFLAGGPVAAGLTALTAGVSLLASGFGDVEESVKRSREETGKFIRDVNESIGTAREQIDALEAKIAEQRGEAPAGSASQKALEKEGRKRLRAIDEQIEHEQQKWKAWESKRQSLLRDNPDTGEFALPKEAAKHAEWIANSQKKILALEIERSAILRLNAVEAEKARLDAEAGEAKKSDEAAERRRADAVRFVAKAEAEVRKEKEESLKATERLTAAEQERAEASVRGMAAARDRASELYRMQQSQTEQAMKDGESMMLRLGKKLTENAERARREREAAGESLAKSEKEQAALASRRAEDEAKITAEKRAQSAAAKEQADITKRFANFGGSAGGVFGFGAGGIGGTWGREGGGGTRRSPGPAASAKTAFNTKPLEEAAKAAQETSASVSQLPPLFQKVADAQKQLARTAGDALDRVAKITVKTVGALASQQQDLTRRVDRFEQDLARAGVLGIGE